MRATHHSAGGPRRSQCVNMPQTLGLDRFQREERKNAEEPRYVAPGRAVWRALRYVTSVPLFLSRRLWRRQVQLRPKLLKLDKFLILLEMNIDNKCLWCICFQINKTKCWLSSPLWGLLFLNTLFFTMFWYKASLKMYFIFQDVSKATK